MLAQSRRLNIQFVKLKGSSRGLNVLYILSRIECRSTQYKSFSAGGFQMFDFYSALRIEMVLQKEVSKASVSSARNIGMAQRFHWSSGLLRFGPLKPSLICSAQLVLITLY
jgi:hypothetical protein